MRFYGRVHHALSTRPAAGPFDLTLPDEAAALVACTAVSVHRQSHGMEPDFDEELRLATEMMGKVAFATSIPREVLKEGGPCAICAKPGRHATRVGDKVLHWYCDDHAGDGQGPDFH